MEELGGGVVEVAPLVLTTAAWMLLLRLDPNPSFCRRLFIASISLVGWVGGEAAKFRRRSTYCGKRATECLVVSGLRLC